MAFLPNRTANNLIIGYILLTNICLFGISNNVYSQKATLAPIDTITTCSIGSKLQKMRSKELSTLVEADQKDRSIFNNIKEFNRISQKQIKQLNSNDLRRRKRVGEIMGEGCIKTAADYAAAALIYQHGDVPDHYYQAYIWANRAVDLGDSKQKPLVALTIDRYLVSIGKKQLFGSQFHSSDSTNWCTCLQPIEPTFPDAYREKYSQKKLNEQYKLLSSLNKKNKHCTYTECPMQLSPSPQGTVPGFW
jgi:hypothetical protein